jgi:hypothetical protein
MEYPITRAFGVNQVFPAFAADEHQILRFKKFFLNGFLVVKRDVIRCDMFDILISSRISVFLRICPAASKIMT